MKIFRCTIVPYIWNIEQYIRDVYKRPAHEVLRNTQLHSSDTESPQEAW